MCNNNQLTNVLILFLLLFAGNLQAEKTHDHELFTLFTTQQEREIIDNNRYKTEQTVTQAVVTEMPQKDDVAETTQQEEKISLQLAGVTLSQSGQNVAWLNGKAYENGSKMEDGSTVIINRKIKNLVQVKTPDGKYHAVTTGETLDISYLKPVNE